MPPLEFPHLKEGFDQNLISKSKTGKSMIFYKKQTNSIELVARPDQKGEMADLQHQYRPIFPKFFQHPLVFDVNQPQPQHCNAGSSKIAVVCQSV